MLPGGSKEMNKKIKQLWDNSIEEFSKQHQYATIMLPEPLREKFAELIVRECLDHIDTMERIAHASNASIPDDYDKYTYLKTLDVLKSLIKSQFGVKE